MYYLFIYDITGGSPYNGTIKIVAKDLHAANIAAEQVLRDMNEAVSHYSRGYRFDDPVEIIELGHRLTPATVVHQDTGER